LILLAVRIWVVVGLGALAMLYFTDVLPLTLLGEALFDGIDSFALIAVPLFILTGDVLVRSGLSTKLLDVAEATMGARRSGLGTSTVLGCGFFACISGSDAADAAAISRITIDRLVDKGYPRPYACALVAAGACTGILIPPSISYIIIGLVLGISASTLFLAAAIPGVMILTSIMITNAVINRVTGYENSLGGFNLTFWLKTLYEGRFALLIPFIILGNKSDLPGSIDQAQIEQFVKKSQAETQDMPFEIKYLKTSAKSGLNVTEAFEQLGLTIGDYIEEYKKLHM